MEWVIPAIVLVLAVWGTLIHRRLSRLRMQALAAWPDLAAVLGERHGLVAHILRAAQTHAPREKKLLDNMISARNAAIVADLSPRTAGLAERQLTDAIGRVLALARTHPELAKDALFLRLETKLAGLEAAMAEAKDAFNREALVFNLAATGVPAILIAKFGNMLLLEYFALDKEAEAAMRAARGVTF